MATLTVKELAARYKLAASRQALVDRYKVADNRGFKPGVAVKVKPSHGFKKWRGDVGVIDKMVPINKAYVELEGNGRQIVDLNDLEQV